MTFETNRMNGNHAMRESKVGSESVEGNEQNKNEYQDASAGNDGVEDRWRFGSGSPSYGSCLMVSVLSSSFSLSGDDLRFEPNVILGSELRTALPSLLESSGVLERDLDTGFLVSFNRLAARAADDIVSA